MIGAVVIGRNEGPRLRRCLESIAAPGMAVVYVDSGSDDDSVALARRMKVEAISLDLRVPFTAARARNEGFRRLAELHPDVAYVQFVDADCELAGGWLHGASAFLASHDSVGMVCGRLRERFPEESLYNMLCDIEWDRPAGEIRECGGIAMARRQAFQAVGGFRGDLIAGEERELCVRLRSAGWHIWRLADDMALHEAAIRRFGQWWKRAVRTGFAYAQAAHLHGAPPERSGVRESRSAWLWGLGMPLGAVVLTLWASAWALAVFLLYPCQVVRLAVTGKRSRRENWWNAAFLVLGKFPEMVGQLMFLLCRLRRRQASLIEYK